MKSIALLCLAVTRAVILFGCLSGTSAFASFSATPDPTVCTVAPCFTYSHSGWNFYNGVTYATGPQPSREVACIVWASKMTESAQHSPPVVGWHHENPRVVEGVCYTDIYNANGNLDGPGFNAGVATQTAAPPSAPVYRCPNSDTATVSGSTCSCNAGYTENAAKKDCTPGGVGGTVVNVFNTSKPLKCPAELTAGKPISPLVGAETYTLQTGVSLGGQPLVLTYDNRKVFTAASAGLTPMTLGSAPALGGLWESSLHRNIKLGTGGFGAQLFRGNGRVVNFNFNPDTNVFDATADVSDKLQVIPSGYRYTQVAARTFEEYNAAGQLTLIADAAGSTWSFRYSQAAGAGAPAAGYLLEVTDNTLRSIKFEYTLPAGGVAATDGLLSKIVDTMGRNITAAYTGGNLVSLTWQDGKTRQFLYENSSLTWALTGVMDENSARYATFGYDSQGRAISTEVGAGVNKYTASYSTPPQTVMTQTYDAATQITTRVHDWVAPSGVVLTLPNGQTSTVTAANVQGMPALGGMSQPAGSGCAAASNAQSYDANGNLASQDDFSGQRSCYAYDGSNRETVRVEGLANTVACASVLPGGSTLPTGSRKSEMTWHPDWQLPIKVSGPLLRTTTVYHGQPDPFNGNVLANCATAPVLSNGKTLPLVCKQVVQVTTDADGALGLAATVDAGVAARTASFTYDGQGRMLTSTDPLNRVTTYVYYSTSGSFSDSEAGADPSYGSVSVLLRGGGANNSTVMTDSASSPKAVTVFGNARISAAQSKFGGSSIAFDGDGDYLSVPAGPGNNFNFGTGDFTIETWFYLSSPGSGYRNLFVIPWGATYMMIRFGDGGFGGRLQFASEASGFPTVYSSEHTQASLAGAWHHVAFTRSNGLSRAFLDGNLLTLRNNIFSGPPVTSWADTSNIASVAQAFVSQTGGVAWLGYMDDVRITRGVARYTASFTPATGPVLAPNATGHTAGDLQSVANPAGHVKQFTLYDRAGRVRQSIDPKGVVTDTVYTPRGWTSSVTVTPPGGTARTTSYTYDNAGQLTGAALPDGTTLGYSYDAAHRLTGVTDAKGNSVTYTLDNTGNKTGEQVKDPSGNLQRNITRVYDALNRVQQVTGASN
ncbi:LamG-like jellyroll fold domain-containing protein [Polaromonas sp. YR568]|uniref:LamG-like jellyroll fold domain-containing protein n=1 Tax=Polaromonas sp. YR568 TaxID=1855301 RepID=UPI00398BF3D7